MRRFLFASLLLIVAVSPAFSQKILSADAVMQEARAVALKENKNVFIIFHASWCGWCRKMDASMNDASVRAFFDSNYVVRHLTVKETPNKKAFENPGADEMLEKYHGGGSIPYWLVFDAKGNFLADSRLRKEGDAPEGGTNVGCPANEAEVAYFIKVLRQTSSISDHGLGLIYGLFRKNE